VIYFGVGASLIMGMVGLMAAIWSEKFDHIAAVGNFIIMPMTFLSGTFYMVDRLPEPFRAASHYNPFFYLIAGFRYGFIGQADGSLLVGVAMTAVLTVALGAGCIWMFVTGYKMKT
jgi:ABC-2 type transport system permease protein